jgi:hypothetical protein
MSPCIGREEGYYSEPNCSFTTTLSKEQMELKEAVKRCVKEITGIPDTQMEISNFNCKIMQNHGGSMSSS